MTRVTAQLSVSLDGYYAGPRHNGAGDWVASAESAGFFRVTRWATDAMAWRERQGFTGGLRDTNSEVVAESFETAGAYVMGRRMADGGEVPWGDEPPFRAPVFVVTHRPRPTLLRGGGTSFTYVTEGVAAAVDRARAAAGDRDVAVAGGGSLVRQVLVAGLLDELELHVVPVLLGAGLSLFDGGLGLGAFDAIELSPARVLHTPQVTHIRYAVHGRAPLVFDDRGSGGGPTTAVD
ncbi:RibD C-terminal domain-containing protein [Micromonospora nigra]|uniref:RibD C-terminal domain-containing protein n=1 Tax=Micromonospora nigra TaxID=145857 RepID=A0A1C6RIK2_9ACTN|nr:dihydrofolate reductase family protein [Micromonospora nigra]SCL17026.1 RibD C-terminal domain-containing protein [Micromonospora nigra]